jgi:hypothetical protein
MPIRSIEVLSGSLFILCLGCAGAGAGASVGTGASASPSQVADPDFKPRIKTPAYAEGSGPVVCLDEAHYNFHTASGRYAPFADLLRRDGYVVKPSRAAFAKESFADCGVLIIANALSKRNQRDWSLPIDPAFTDEEVARVSEWVSGGGALFLIVDHMPIPGANQALAGAFGVHFSNGFAMIPGAPGPMIFRRGEGSLADHAVTNGQAEGERIDAVATFTGSAFRVDKGAEPILVFGPRVVSLEPKVAWQFTPDTPRVGVGGWYQGATLRHGSGRVAVFGEAAMFTAQVAGEEKRKVGMNAPEAPQNAQLLLNVMHWLTGKLSAISGE